MAQHFFPHTTVVDSSSEFHLQQVDLLLKDGKISQIAPAGEEKISFDAEVHEYEGLHVSPGWLDLEAHLSDPGHEHKERIEDLALAAQRGGFTSLLVYPLTHPPLDNSQSIKALISRAKALPVEILPSGCLTQGASGKDLAEVYDMHQAGALAFTDGIFAQKQTETLLLALPYLQAFGGRLITGGLDSALAQHGFMHEGNMSTRLGMKGIPEMAEVISVVRDLQLLEYLGGQLHFQPLSSPKAIREIQAAKKRKLTVSLGVPIHYLVLEDSLIETYNSLYRTTPPLRDQEILTQLHDLLNAGQIDVITSGHQAQGIEEKEVEFSQAEPGMLSLQTVYPLAQAHLIDKGHMSLTDWVNCVSTNPRKVLGLAPLSIQKGAPVELTFFQPHRTWAFEPHQIASRAKNSPFLGQSFKGFVPGIYQKGAFRENL